MIRSLTVIALLCACQSGPAQKPRKDVPMYRPLVHGHRGARALRPENSLAAFAYALDVGVDVLELDLAVTKDDVLVVMHDLAVNPAHCQWDDGGDIPPNYLVRQHTFAELSTVDCGSRGHERFPQQARLPGTRIAKLSDVLSLATARDDNVQFNIETKIQPGRPELSPSPAAFVALVIDALRAAGVMKRTYLQSFDKRTLRAARAQAPTLRRVMLTSDNLVDFVALAEAEDAHISPDQWWITDDDVDALHAAGREVIPWTANEPDQWQRLTDMRVDSIITDDPAACIDWLSAKGFR